MSDWDGLVREHGPVVFGTAWRILGHAADTEDVVQDVFIEADRIRQTRQVRHWGALLRRLAACRAIDRLRQRKDTQPLDDQVLVDRADTPDAAAMNNELSQRLRQAIATLPAQEGAVFCLRYFDDLSNQRIGEVLNLRPGAVAVALHKARARLESLLTDTPEEANHVPIAQRRQPS